MAKDQKAAEHPNGIAEQAMEQARRAADIYCDFVKQAIAATPSGGNEFAERIKGYAERNITLTQEYLRQLSQARNFQDMVRIQADFMQSLMKAFGEQSLALLWQIHLRCCSLQIHFLQYGHRCGGSRAISSRIAWRTAGNVG